MTIVHFKNSVFATLALFFAVLPVHAHEDQRVSIEKDSESPVTAGEVEIRFELVDVEARSVLAPTDLTVTHERTLHAFVFDAALSEFRHEHPEFENGKWILRSSLPVNGDYWLWVQGKLAADGAEFSSSSPLKIQSGTPANAIPPALGDVRSGTSGDSRVRMDNTVFRANRMVMFNLDFSRTDGSTPAITPYLGSLAHVVAVSKDGESLLHVHPMETGSTTTLMIHTEFHDPGEYRLWVQFLDAGELKVVPLSVTVLP